MVKFARAAALAAAAVLSIGVTATASQAAVLYATSVDAYNPVGTIAPQRTVTANALGAPDGKFLSLGLGGNATFSFGQRFGQPGAIVEVTFGRTSKHVESVNIFGINGLVTTFLGSLSNAVLGGTFNFSGFYQQLKLVDTSPLNGGSKDGFDVESISVTPAPVPLPAGGLLLLGALGGIAALRRRKSV